VQLCISPLEMNDAEVDHLAIELREERLGASDGVGRVDRLGRQLGACALSPQSKQHVVPVLAIGEQGSRDVRHGRANDHLEAQSGPEAELPVVAWLVQHEVGVALCLCKK
jgi:hypothetical protein